MTVFNFFIYSAETYSSMVTCITGSALALNFTASNYLVTLGQRGAYTLAGAVIAWFANSYIFPIRAKNQFLYIKDILSEIRRDAAAADTLAPAERMHHMNQLIVKSYLMIMRLESYYETAKKHYPDVNIEAEARHHILTMAQYILPNRREYYEHQTNAN